MSQRVRANIQHVGMQLNNTLQVCAEAAHNRRLTNYYTTTGTNPETLPRSPLMGYCFENTRELSWELTQRCIPHRIVNGGIALDCVEHYPHWLLEETEDGTYNLPGDVKDTIERYIGENASETGYVDPELWNEIPKPETRREIPDEANHFWIEVNGKETVFDTTETFTVEVAAEARKHYGNPVVYNGVPTEFYITPENGGYTDTWKNHDEWEWNPENPCEKNK